MGAYWMLECRRDPERGGRSIEAWPDFPGVPSWVGGVPIEAKLPVPIVLHWDPEDEAGPAQPLYKAGIPMMTRGLHEALIATGVDNLQSFPVEIRSKSTAEVNRDFVAFNVVGLVRAVDWDKTPPRAPGTPEMFAAGLNGVVLNEAAAHGLLLFRLAENVGAIVVHDRLRTELDGRFPGLKFVAPEDWAG